jgi:hypothetical protein
MAGKRTSHRHIGASVASRMFSHLQPYYCVLTFCNILCLWIWIIQYCLNSEIATIEDVSKETIAKYVP